MTRAVSMGAAEEVVASLPVVTIKPTHGLGSLGLRDVWEYRELVYFMTLRAVQGLYRQMALGPLWIILQPLVEMLIFTAVFGRLAKLPSEGIPYPLFVYVALLPWQFFAKGTQQTARSLFDQRFVIAKIYFPRLVLPISSLAACLVDFGASFLILIVMLVLYRVRLSWTVLILPLFLLWAAATTMAIGLWLAGLAVKFQDVNIGIAFVLKIWQYLTPVAYSAVLVPQQWHWIYRLNPLYGVVQGFRWALLGVGQPPDWITALSAGVVLVALVSGAFFFRHTERTIVDVI